MVESYRDLIVGQRAIEMALAVYRATASFPKGEVYGLTSQLRRSSVSVANHTAEGYGRQLRGDNKQFLGIARGSNFEVQTQLVIAARLAYSNGELLQTADNLSVEAERMVDSLISKL